MTRRSEGVTPAPVRLRGVTRAASGDASAFRRVTLVAEGKTVATVDEGEIELALADGGSAVIEIPAEGTQLIDPTIEIARGAWSELRERPEAAGLARNVVAPFASVELRTIGAPIGETLEVYGEAFATEVDDAAGSFRDAPSKTSRVLAQLIAFGGGADAMRAMTMAIADLRQSRQATTTPAKAGKPKEDDDRATVSPGAAWLPAGVLGLLVLGGVALLFAGLSPAQAWRTEVVILLLATLALAARPVPDTPELRSRERAMRTVTFGAILLARMILGVIPIGLVMAISNGHGSRDLDFSPLGYLIGALVFVGGWFVTVLLSDRPAHVALATLVGAPRLAFATTDGKSGTLEGTVFDATPVDFAGAKAAMGVVTEMKKGFGRKNPDVEKSVKLVGRGTFALETSEGRVEIDPDECLWATTVTERPSDPTFDYSISEWIPVGGKLAAHGRFVRREAKKGKPALHLTAMGTRAAVLFATAAAGRPLELASRIVWQRRATLVVLVLAAGALIALYQLRM